MLSNRLLRTWVVDQLRIVDAGRCARKVEVIGEVGLVGRARAADTEGERQGGLDMQDESQANQGHRRGLAQTQPPQITPHAAPAAVLTKGCRHSCMFSRHEGVLGGHGVRSAEGAEAAKKCSAVHAACCLLAVHTVHTHPAPCPATQNSQLGRHLDPPVVFFCLTRIEHDPGNLEAARRGCLCFVSSAVIGLAAALTPPGDNGLNVPCCSAPSIIHITHIASRRLFSISL